MQKIIIFTQNHYGNHYQAYQMWYHLVGNFISFHMTPLLCRKNALFKHDSQITKYMFKMAAILEKAPSRNSSQDTACLPQIFLFPVKNWSRKTTWKFLLLQVAPPSVLTWSIRELAKIAISWIGNIFCTCSGEQKYCIFKIFFNGETRKSHSFKLRWSIFMESTHSTR